MFVTTATSPKTILVEFEPAAEAHFDDRPVNARVAKDKEGGGGQEIEPGRFRRRALLSAGRLIGVERAGQRAGERRFVDVVALQAHALGHMLDMRRAIAADLEPRADERRLDQRRNRALALRARDMDRAKGLLRIAEARRQVEHRLEPYAHRTARPPLPVGQLIESRHRAGDFPVFSHRPHGRRQNRAQTLKTWRAMAHAPSFPVDRPARRGPLKKSARCAQSGRDRYWRQNWHVSLTGMLVEVDN